MALDNDEDYWEWWQCYLTGSLAGIRAVTASQLGPVKHELDHLKERVKKAVKAK